VYSRKNQTARAAVTAASVRFMDSNKSALQAWIAWMMMACAGVEHAPLATVEMEQKLTAPFSKPFPLKLKQESDKLRQDM
jgi:hypothetical protein